MLLFFLAHKPYRTSWNSACPQPANVRLETLNKLQKPVVTLGGVEPRMWFGLCVTEVCSGAALTRKMKPWLLNSAIHGETHVIIVRNPPV